MKLVGKFAGPSILAMALASTVALAQTTPTTPPAEQSAPPMTQEQQPGAMQQQQQAPADAMAQGPLTEQKSDERLSSNIVGTPIVDQEGNEIGEISDLIVDAQQQVVGAIVATGGFLRLGSKSVGVPWQSLDVQEREDGLVATLNMTEQELEEAPEYRTLEDMQQETQQPAGTPQ